MWFRSDSEMLWHKIIFLPIENVGSFIFCYIFPFFEDVWIIFSLFSPASCESIGGSSGAWWQASGGVDERMHILKSGWHPLNLNPLYGKCWNRKCFCVLNMFCGGNLTRSTVKACVCFTFFKCHFTLNCRLAYLSTFFLILTSCPIAE